MKGFDDKALILFPKLENYEYKSSAYKYEFKKAVNNLCAYLESIGVEPHVFYTDDIARELKHPDFKWVSTLSKADRFFVQKYCDNTSEALSAHMIEFDDIYNEITAKDPGSMDMGVEERFEMVLRHDSKAATKIIPNYKIVVHFMVKGKTKYKVTTKQGDGKIRINVNATNFLPTVYMSGNEENACDLLAVPYANRCLHVWEV